MKFFCYLVAYNIHSSEKELKVLGKNIKRKENLKFLLPNSRIEGSSLKTSSPTTAEAIACLIASLGLNRKYKVVEIFLYLHTW